MALVGYMYRDLVENRRWISEAEYKEGLMLAQLAPGPLAAQLAIYLGYCHYGIPGATFVGIAFALPSFLMVVALGWAYLRYGGLSWMQAVFYGVGACIIGIIARSAQKLTTKTLGKSGFLWLIFSGMALVTFLTEHESISLILTAGLLTWLVQIGSSHWRQIRENIFFAAQALFLYLLALLSCSSRRKRQVPRAFFKLQVRINPFCGISFGFLQKRAALFLEVVLPSSRFFLAAPSRNFSG